MQKQKSVIKDQRGVAPVLELLLLMAVLTVLGFVGWRYYQARQTKMAQPAQTAAVAKTEYKRTTTIPKDWKAYTSSKYKFSISYPSNWEIDAAEGGQLAESSTAKNKETFTLGFRPYVVGPREIQHTFDVTHETMDDAIAFRKDTTSDKSNKGSGVQLTISSEKRFTFDGHSAVRFDLVADDGTPPNSYLTEFYIEANGLLYKFDTGFNEAKPVLNSTLLTIFESLRITK